MQGRKIINKTFGSLKYISYICTIIKNNNKMTGINHKGERVELKPTPLTEKQLADMKIQHEKERQERLALLDNTEVQARLYYYRGLRNATRATQFHGDAKNAGKEIWMADVDMYAYGEAIVIGTERQRCEDDTFDKVTGIYTLNLTDKMKEAYKANGNKILISKQF